MSLDKMLEKVENKSEIIDYVNGLVSAETDKGIVAAGKKGDENKRITAENKALKGVLTGAGIDITKGDSPESRYTSMGEQLGNLSTSGDDFKKVNGKLATALATIETINQENSAFKKDAAEVRQTKLINGTKAMFEGAGAHRYNDKVEVWALKSKVQFGDNEEINYHDGDKIVPLTKELIQNMAKDDDGIQLKNQNKGGSGGGGNGQTSGDSEPTWSEAIDAATK